MTSAEEHFLAGLSLHKAGRAAEAEAAYRAALAVEANHFTALQHLGALLSDRGATAEAADLFAKASRLRAGDPVIFYQLGTALADLKRYDEALAALDAALAIKSDIPLLHAGRGSILHALKRHGEAIAAYDSALKLRPNDALTIANRAAALQLAGRTGEALAAIDRSLALHPNDPKSLIVRGLILSDLGEMEKALADFDRAIRLDPANGEAYLRLGGVRAATGAFGAAVAMFSQALARDPANGECWSARGGAYYGLRQYEQAVADCSAAIARDPELAAAYYNRSNALTMLNRLDEALADATKALALDPELTHAAVTRFIILANRCQWPERQAAAAEVARCCQNGRYARPFPLLYLADIPALHRLAAAAAAGPSTAERPPLAVRDKLKIGYLSADFRDHVVAHQLVEVLERHDRSGFEITGIGLAPAPESEIRRRLLQAFDRYTDAVDLSDADLAKKIATLDLDIVVDLSGYTEMGRPKALAARPAPIAVNFLGYAGTLGADYVDYIIADAEVIPPENEPYFAEKIARLPCSFMPRDTTVLPGAPPSRAEAGLPDEGLVFGAFANGYKIEPEVFEVWLRLLSAVPQSVLWLSLQDETARTNLRGFAVAHGIAAERLVFAPRIAGQAAYLGRLALADLFLDTRCYGAHATASDVLYTAVPLVTVTGHSFATRVGTGLLTFAGLGELVAADLAQYETIALDLARDPRRRAAIREKLTAQRPALFDMSAYARALETAYRTMVTQIREGRPASFSVAVP